MTSDTLTPSASDRSMSSMIKKLRQQNSGMVPVLIALVALVIFFQARSSVFLSSSNVANLLTQASIYILLGMAEVWVLLLGEIDLSLGWVAGLSGTLAGIFTNVQYGWPWWLAFAFALAVSTGIGFISGILVVKLNLPSFIVTLAGLLGWEGFLIYILDKVFQGGGVPVQNQVLNDLIGGNLTLLWTWIVLIAVVVCLGGSMIYRDRKRRSVGLSGTSPLKLISVISLMAVLAVATGLLFDVNRGSFVVVNGMPFAVPIVIVILSAYSFALSRTKFGRYMYAIGGNAEAARRAGIPVNRYRVYAFMLGGLTAGIAGLLYISRLGGYATSSTDQSVVLYAVGAAVIGGTSLFGGRGKMVYAVVGGIILAVIINGMALLQLSGPAQYMVTAFVLLAAVIVDSFGRRSSASTR